MFRPMRRFKQQLTEEECKKILKEEWRGVLALLGDDDYPYAVPINFYYEEPENKIYFHGGGEGHKIDAVKKYDKASFCVYDKGFRKEGDWALHIKSVVAFGKIRIVEERDLTLSVCRKLGLKYAPDPEYVEQEIKQHFARTVCLELSVEHMTGKLVNES